MDMCPDPCDFSCPNTCSSFANPKFITCNPSDILKVLIFFLASTICGILTVIGILFCFRAFYIGSNKFVDDKNVVGYTNECLYFNGIIVGFSILGVLVIIGSMHLGHYLRHSQWSYSTLVAHVLFMHLAAGSSICVAFYPFGYIKRNPPSYDEVMQLDSYNKPPN